MPSPPHWQLPPGVPSGTWEYGTSDAVTQDYDRDLADHPLFRLDRRVLDEWLPPPQPGEFRCVVDLGCGTGRALLPLLRGGLSGLAVDLSEKMLRIVRTRAAAERLPVQCVRANLVELECLADCCADYAMCLFSTLGMIRGSDNRQRVVSHAARILKPGGRFVLHVHNYWYNLYDPGGPWWLVRNALRAAVRRDVERGDKFFPFRDVGQMYLHVFRRGEVRRLLHRAKFVIRAWLPLAPRRLTPLRWPWWCQSLRANGWIIVCDKPG